MSAPRKEILAFALDRWPGCSIQSLAGDASTRRFYRVLPTSGPTRVLMDYGAPFAGETDDQRLQGIFSASGLPTAEIAASSPRTGCLVLEDLGDTTLELRLEQAGPGGGEDWLGRAVDLAVQIAERGTEQLARSPRSSGPCLDADRFQFEMEFFVEHYVGGLLGATPAPELLPELTALAQRAAETPRKVLCHRDFHRRNIMLQQDGRLSLVDIQDARWGPDSYDLASLLFDAYGEIGAQPRDRLVERYRRALADPPEVGEFRERFLCVGAQRMIKALGTFGYQIRAKGDERYREGIPRTLSRLRRILPALPGTVALGTSFEESGLFDPT